MSKLLLVSVLYALHGVWASGFLPITHAAAKGAASAIFGAYFVGVVIGQLAVWRFAFITKSARSYALIEAGFALTLLGMGLFYDLGSVVLVVGRLAEGLFAGAALPLLFSVVRTAEGASVGRRLSIMNSMFALGFAAGPFLVETLLRWATVSALLKWGALPFVLGSILLLAFNLGAAQTEEAALPTPSLVVWRTRYYTVFLAKCFYGLLLPFVAHTLTDAFAPMPLAGVMGCFTLVFVIGQVAVSQLVRVVPAQRLALWLPPLLGLVLLVLALSFNPWLIFLAGLLHSAILFVGYFLVADTAPSARAFALNHCLSDPGMIIGSVLSAFGLAGVGLMALLSFTPLLVTRQRSV